MKIILEELLAKYEEFRKTGTLQLTSDQTYSLKSIMRELYNININASCISCITHNLATLEAYYQRNYVLNKDEEEQVEVTVKEKEKTTDNQPQKRKYERKKKGCNCKN